METIVSRQNNLIKERIKLRQKKYRRQTGLFLLEGVRLVEEAVAARQLAEVFVDGTLVNTARGIRLMESLEGSPVECYQVSPEILHTLAETESPQGIVGVARQVRMDLGALTPQNGLVLILDGVQDPGNLGTIWRTAWAAGVEAICCLPGTVDPFNGKTVRATMGGIFHIPVFTGEEIDWSTMRQWCQNYHYQVVAGDPGADQFYDEGSYAQRVALVIGNEAQGLLSVASADLDKKVKIPLLDGAESLNAAVACGILLYEILRQRKTTSFCQ